MATRWMQHFENITGNALILQVWLCVHVCACLCVHVYEIEREAWREKGRGRGESQFLGLCIYVSPSTGFPIFPLFSSLPLSFFSFSIFPLTTSITLKMNITWHGGTHFYDLLYSLTRTFCSLLKRRQHNRHKSPQWFPEPSGLGWMKAPLPSTFCLIGNSFSKGSSIVAGPKTVEMCLCPR